MLDTEYMSNEYKFTEKEKEVLRILAEQGPKTGYQLFRGGWENEGRHEKPIMSSSTWLEIKARLGPENLNLILPIGIPKKEGRRKVEYWLMIPAGIYAALFVGADFDKLKRLLESLKILAEGEEDPFFVSRWFIEALGHKEAFSFKNPAYQTVMFLFLSNIQKKRKDPEFLRLARWFVEFTKMYAAEKYAGEKGKISASPFYEDPD